MMGVVLIVLLRQISWPVFRSTHTQCAASASPSYWFLVEESSVHDDLCACISCLVLVSCVEGFAGFRVVSRLRRLRLRLQLV